ncbi:helix-turn-helix domain-containing protein [Muricauda sp. JGD-17]|uniref:Helix-turn-helix domain-containing protein n=1 Tax=Flagellimonas ochracea TaxID=2696472 RepID=A0A964TE03_9FLAO|nr:AraC family transcriptional regulator [Allomuricauda ochracea]NAY91741.1 helix-turn-helix domain-containing protein [Allomuricauda ochracea]
MSVEHNIQIKNQGAKAFVETVGNGLDLEYTEDDKEFSLNLSAELGHGYIKTYDFDHGLTVYEFDCTLSTEIRIIFSRTTVQPLLILFNREDEIGIEHGETGLNEVKHLESVMSSGGTEKDQAIIIHSNRSTCFFALVLDRKVFENKIDTFLPNMNTNLEKIFRDVNGINSFYTQGYYSLDIAKFMEEFTTTDLTGFMRYVFLEGKTYEIFTHFLKQYLDDAKNPNQRRILRQHTVEKIEEASTIIQDEMENLGSIVSLAKKVGLNQNTLQEGFQQLYKKSVNHYITEVRMAEAKRLMEESDLNITEITYQVGINSRSYFSKLFKQQFGISPKDYVIKNRNKKGANRSA